MIISTVHCCAVCIVVCCVDVCCLQALRSRRLLHNSGGGGPKGAKRSSMHSMLTLQLDSYEADGTPLQRNTLSFVELAAPEPKVTSQSHSDTAHVVSCMLIGRQSCW